jgi:putative nucleotidyltransferase with HDIG domain
MESKHIYYSIITALIIVVLYHLFALGRFSYPEFRLKAGQVSDAELIAPFDFPLLKSEEKLLQEKQETIARLKKPYRISDDQLFEANSKVDAIFMTAHADDNTDPGALEAALSAEGYIFSAPSLVILQNKNRSEPLYQRINTELDRVYRKGIYEGIRGDSLLFISGDELKEVSLGLFFSVEEARESFINRFQGSDALSLIQELAPQVIKANLVLDDNRLSQLTEDATRQISQTEGMILKNEVIIRKNARVTEADIMKLNSLQAEYRTREISRSPVQQLMISLGLLLFVFLIIFLSNKYFLHVSRNQHNKMMESLPLNAGFILTVLFCLISNKLLGFSNLLIPFGMISLASAILIGVDFGVFYSLSNLFVMSPFINWETYTPVVLVMTSMITLILMLRYHSFHNYLNIWFYMILSGVAVNLSLGIYKNDPFLTIMTTTGYSLISSSISVIGLVMIVPYYEKRWHRATRQTLLELLDFEHPLLKKLATDAIGTYHHSLIIGNLTERAAEAIGANPLLARVGSYYHDIGKVVNTDIFTENNEDSSEIHNEFEPEESARLIKGHVLEGIELAKRYKIPQPVIDIIMQHHGTGSIRYFLEQAKRENKLNNMEPFTYPGPRPQSKEAALVMMADIIESTTKAKNITKEEDIHLIVEQTIQRLIKENQFDEAPITLKEIFLAKQAMIPVLVSIYRKRLDYPDIKPDESAN